MYLSYFFSDLNHLIYGRTLLLTSDLYVYYTRFNLANMLKSKKIVTSNDDNY